VDEIYMFEEKLKRSYFHVKPLDHKQLKTWDQYLDYEIERGDHERIVVLFERSIPYNTSRHTFAIIRHLLSVVNALMG
jgi:hypothetical protein